MSQTDLDETSAERSQSSPAENEVIEGVLCGVNHQLRTPLNGILASVDLLASTPLSDRQRTLMSIIADAAATLLGSVEDLLAVAAGSGPEPRRRVCETSQELTTLLEPHRLRLADQSRDLIININSDVPAQSAGPWDLITTIVDHLVDNAETYATDGPVTVELAHAELGWACLTVSDDGIGIPPEWIDQVTRPFARVDTSLTAPPGAGLGLAVVRRAIDTMHGFLSIASTPGTGTVVTCRFPLEPATGSTLAPGGDVDIPRDITASPGSTALPDSTASPEIAASPDITASPETEMPSDTPVLDSPVPAVAADNAVVRADVSPPDPVETTPPSAPAEPAVVLVAITDPAVRDALVDAVEATNGRTALADTVDEALFKIDTAAQLGSPVSCALVDPSIVDRRGRPLDVLLGRRDDAIASMRIEPTTDSEVELDRVDAFVREHGEHKAPDALRVEAAAGRTDAVNEPSETEPSDADTDAAPAGAAGVPAPTDTAGPGALRILVAEDNTTNQLVIRTLLERLGHTAVLVENGQLAVDAILNDTFDMILMDCMMPELDGFGATEAIRKLDEPACSTPILALTANAMKGDRERCLEAGMDEYLSKPVRLDLLKEMIQLLIVEGASARR